MNEKQIKAELMILAKDMQELPASTDTKMLGAGSVVYEQARSLLTHDSEQDGALVKWFNREHPERTRKILARVVKLTVKAYQGKHTSDDGIELAKLCERLESPSANLPNPIETDEQVYARVLVTWESVKAKKLSHTKRGEAMAAQLSNLEWQRYRKVASTKADIAVDAAAHFRSKSTKECKKPKSSPQ